MHLESIGRLDVEPRFGGDEAVNGATLFMFTIAGLNDR